MPRIKALPPNTEGLADADVFPIHNDSTDDTEKVTISVLKDTIKTWLQSLTAWVSLSNLKSEILQAFASTTSVYAFAPGNSNNFAVTGMTVTVTVPDGSPNLAIKIGVTAQHKSGNAGFGFHGYIYKDGVQTWSFTSNTPGTTSSNDVRGYIFSAKDTGVSSGSHTYAFYVAVSGSTSANVDFRPGCFISVTPVQ